MGGGGEGILFGQNSAGKVSTCMYIHFDLQTSEIVQDILSSISQSECTKKHYSLVWYIITSFTLFNPYLAHQHTASTSFHRD